MFARTSMDRDRQDHVDAVTETARRDVQRQAFQRLVVPYGSCPSRR